MPFTLRDEEWEEMIYEFENQYNPHGLLGIYLEPNLPQRFKVDIAEYLQRRNPDLWEEFQQQKPEVMDEARKWEQRWTRRSMDRHAQPLGGETPPEPESLQESGEQVTGPSEDGSVVDQTKETPSESGNEEELNNLAEAIHQALPAGADAEDVSAIIDKVAEKKAESQDAKTSENTI